MVSNMLPAYDSATYVFLWISTSRIEGEVLNIHDSTRAECVCDKLQLMYNITANELALLDMVHKLQNDATAIVHQMPFVSEHSGLSRALERV